MSKKTTVHIADSTQAFARQRYPEDTGASTYLNAAVSDLQYLLRRSLPPLTDQAWTQILNAYSAHAFGTTLQECGQVPIWECLMDDLGLTSPQDASEADLAIILQARQFTAAEELAVLDMVRQYWNHSPDTRNHPTVGEQIAALLAP
ncbi:MAG: hypothetical protein AWU57_194 [Marinobacter sp. T13-3]|nr:MAG: hypothetical protein AWU57_194 [Marinobacter sp. T13-3]